MIYISNIGGALWSLSVSYGFIFFNFIATAIVLVVCLIINQQVPDSIAVKKKATKDRKAVIRREDFEKRTITTEN